MPNPFGIALRSTPGHDEAEYEVSFKRIPRPHPDLPNYVANWRPDSGIDRLFASSRINEDDAYGSQSLTLYDRLRSQLIKAYGECEDFHHLKPGAIYDEDRDFVHSLSNGERFHTSVWNAQSGSTLDSGIQEIRLMILATGYDSSQVVLSYSSEAADASQSADGEGIDAL